MGKVFPVLLLLSTHALPGDDEPGELLIKENLDLPFYVGDTEDYGERILEDPDNYLPDVIVFYGQIYEGDGIFYCLDRSGSTANGTIQRTKIEVVRNVTSFSSHVEFGIVFFNETTRKYPSSGRPTKATATAKKSANAFVLAMEPGKGTCVARGLADTLTMANASTTKRTIVLYLGDGCTTCPGRDESKYARQTLEQVRSWNFDDFPIHAIAIGPGSEVCPDFPRELANQNRGSYRRITTAP